MATKQFKVLKDMKYGTRMLRAGEHVEMDAPMARLYTALGAVGPRDADGSGNVLPPQPAAPIAAPRPRAPRKPRAKKATKKA
jgi:hypothetical protein